MSPSAFPFTNEIVFAVSSVVATLSYVFLQKFSQAALMSKQPPGFSSLQYYNDIFSLPVVQGSLGALLCTALMTNNQLWEGLTNARNFLRQQGIAIGELVGQEEIHVKGASANKQAAATATGEKSDSSSGKEMYKLVGLAVVAALFLIRKIDPRLMKVSEPHDRTTPTSPSLTQWITLIFSLIFVVLLFLFIMRPRQPEPPSRKGHQQQKQKVATQNVTMSAEDADRTALHPLCVGSLSGVSCANCLHLRRIGYLGVFATFLLSSAVAMLFYPHLTLGGATIQRQTTSGEIPSWAWAAVLAASLPCLIHFNPYEWPLS